MGRVFGYKWVGIILGDLYIKGYFCEVCFKE